MAARPKQRKTQVETEEKSDAEERRQEDQSGLVGGILLVTYWGLLKELWSPSQILSAPHCSQAVSAYFLSLSMLVTALLDIILLR